MQRRRWEHRCEDPHEPLRVTCDLAAPAVLSEFGCVHLDAILTFAAVHVAHYPLAQAATSPTSADNLIDRIAIPVRWDENIWACSALWPPDSETHGIVHWHQRPPVEHAHLTDATRIDTSGTPSRAHRKSLPLTAHRSLNAIVIGNPDHVARLLAKVPSVGKKRSQGYGRVREWHVEPADNDEYRAWGAIARRPLPDARGTAIGLRPPYWYRPWWAPGLPAGSAM